MLTYFVPSRSICSRLKGSYDIFRKSRANTLSDTNINMYDAGSAEEEVLLRC